MRFVRPALVAACRYLAGLVCLALVGCAASIGDSCTTNVQCSPLGDRFCDVGSPGGYCTIEGCDYQTCPDNANCIRFYDLERNVPCTSNSDCQLGELCVCDLLGGSSAPALNPTLGQGIPDAGLSPGCSLQPSTCAQAYCASEKTERVWCMAGCNTDSDCRSGYGCFTTGENGTLAVPYRDDNGYVCPNPPPLTYCAPTPPVVNPGP